MVRTSEVHWLPVSAACGLVVHLVYNRFEPRAFKAHVSLLLAFPIFTILLGSKPSALSCIYAYITFLAALSLSVITYRLSPLHPLSRYPGPLPCRISKLWMLHIVHSGKRHIYLKQVHDKYGPYVRVGPNELSVCDVDAIQPILGTTGMPKGPKWESRTIPSAGLLPILLAVRSPSEHAARRKPWARAFTASAMKEYYPSIVKRAKQLAAVLSNEHSRDGTVDMAQWLGYFTFDFMGDMVFSGGFELMSETKHHDFMHMMHKNLQTGAHIEQLPWATRFFFNIPSIMKDIRNFRVRAAQIAKARYDSKVAGRDLLFHLIDGSDRLPTDSKPTLAQATSDSSFAITAGADTTSSILTNCIYCLTSNPAELRKLREEVDLLFANNIDDSVLFDNQRLAGMKYLNAVINETLRLFPAVPSGSERMSLPGMGSKAFGGHVIPEGNSVCIPTYVLQRDPRYFAPLPDTFWPERWIIAGANDSESDEQQAVSEKSVAKSNESRVTAKQTVVHNMSAFVPFSYGPRICVGMRLAMIEMRVVIALLVRHFDFAPASESEWRKDAKEYEESMNDWFAFAVGSLRLKVTPRFTKSAV